ncbi:hypothetical protein QAD02_006092 [Eretmocerus hayati]|uniref:Uncharacterized protein n=1 Tax=Eretmocerus hayati TaxID=131215 RepID=A0ACC2N015_9HYME|nr:hypothetical protein QAD02_006092 [Eretmocerus hayati]
MALAEESLQHIVEDPDKQDFTKLGDIVNFQSKSIEEEIRNKKNDSDALYPVTNIRHNPQFLDHMLRRWMPYVCLWNSLVLKRLDIDKSRMTQVYIEAWHRVMEKNGEEGVPLATTSSSRQKPHYPEEQCNPVSQEGFKRKKKKAKRPDYSQGCRIRKQADDTSDSDGVDIENEKSQA